MGMKYYRKIGRESASKWRKTMDAAGEAATIATTIQATGSTRMSRAARDATGNGALGQSRSCFLLLDLLVGVGNSVQEHRVYVPGAVWADCGDARCLPVLDACR